MSNNELRKMGFCVNLDIEVTDDPLKVHEQIRLRLNSLDMPKLVKLQAKIQELEAKLDESSNKASQSCQ